MSDSRIKTDDYLGGYADCYIITENRTKEYLYRFLDRFLPERHVFLDEFEIPASANDSRKIFCTIDELLDYLEKQPKIHCYISWKNLTDDELPFAECMFTNDGFLILGLTCKRKHQQDSVDPFLVDYGIAKNYFQQLQEFASGATGYITVETPPPENRIEFLKECQAFVMQSDFF